MAVIGCMRKVIPQTNAEKIRRPRKYGIRKNIAKGNAVLRSVKKISSVVVAVPPIILGNIINNVARADASREPKRFSDI